MEKSAGPSLRLLNPLERPLAEQVSDLRMLSDGAIQELDNKAQLLVARIAAVGAALAIGFLAADLFGNT